MKSFTDQSQSSQTSKTDRTDKLEGWKAGPTSLQEEELVKKRIAELKKQVRNSWFKSFGFDTICRTEINCEDRVWTLVIEYIGPVSSLHFSSARLRPCIEIKESQHAGKCSKEFLPALILEFFILTCGGYPVFPHRTSGPAMRFLSTLPLGFSYKEEVFRIACYFIWGEPHHRSSWDPLYVLWECFWESDLNFGWGEGFWGWQQFWQRWRWENGQFCGEGGRRGLCYWTFYWLLEPIFLIKKSYPNNNLHQISHHPFCFSCSNFLCFSLNLI